MSLQNKISAVLSAADLQNILTLLDNIRNLLPFLLNLSKKERQALRKIGPKSVEYVNLNMQGALTFPAALTVGFDSAEFQKDAALFSALMAIAVKLNALAEGVNDSMKAVGSDAMVQADEVYSNLKAAAKKDTNAKTLVDDIKKRYAGQGRKAAPKTPTS